MAILGSQQRPSWRWLAAGAAIGLALVAAAWWVAPATGGHDAAAPAAEAARPAIAMVPRAIPAPMTAPSMPVRSVAPAGRLDFDSAGDLYALATAAANSNDPMTLHNGRHAVLVCTFTPLPRSQYEAIAATGTSDATGEERKRAARVVLRKCAGFFDNDAAANNELGKRLRDRLLAQGEYVPNASPPGGPSDQQIATAIDRGDWQTFSGALSELVPRMANRAGMAEKSEDALLLGMAYMESLCDLGQDCSPNGLTYTIQCARSAEMCAGSWEAFFLRGVSEAQLEKVRRLRREIADAYRHKDFAYFGLAP